MNRVLAVERDPRHCKPPSSPAAADDRPSGGWTGLPARMLRG